MATANEVINSALGFILVRVAESPLSSDDEQTAMEALNDMLLEWAGAGIRLGFNPVTGLSDVVTVPDSALLAIKQNLSIVLAPAYGKQADPALHQNARRSYGNILNRAVRVAPAAYPDTLPRGSGNTQWETDQFYDGVVDAQMSMTANTTATTISTADTPVLIGGTWTEDRTRNITWANTGRYTALAETYCSLRASVSLTVPTSSTVELSVAKNGIVMPGSTKTESGTSVHFDLNWEVGMLDNDYIELFVSNVTGTGNITVTNATVVLK